MDANLKNKKPLHSRQFALLAGKFLFSAFFLFPSSLFADPAYTIERQIRYSFTLENSKNTPLEQGDLWVNIPLERTATQWCLRVNPSGEAEWITNSPGNRVLHFKVALPPYGSRIVSITADLKLAPVPQPIAEKLEIRNSKSETNQQSEIGNRKSKIIELSSRLKGPTPLATARNIYQWVADNLKHSGYHKTDRGAAWALENKQGDCTEFASLFAALCRADGIPARALSGFTCPRNLILKPYSLHNWAEFYDGKTWLLADPLERNFATNQSMYVAFAVLDGQSFSVIPDSSGNPGSSATTGVDSRLRGNDKLEQSGFPSALFRYSGSGLIVKMNK